MSEADVPQRGPAPWYDRVSDWFNSILIREARQALKSKQFVATFLLLLAIAWVLSVFGLLRFGSALEFGMAGRTFFFYFFCALAFAAIILVPFTAFRSLQAERDLNTFDLLSITSLKPRQIVWGKLLSISLQLLLFYSAITPFMAFASLLQGFNTATAAVVLIGTMLYSVILSMAALMLSAFAKRKFLQGLFASLLLIGLFFTYMSVIQQAFFILYFEMVSVGDPLFWWIAGILVAVFVAYFFLFQQIAVSQLTFDSDNRSTGIRVVCTIQFWLAWSIVGIYCFARETTPPEWVMLLLVGFSALHLSVSGLVFTTEGDYLSRRVQREIPRNRFWRILKAPFLPGGSRGYLLALFHLVALWWIIVACQGLDAMRPASLTIEEYYSSLLNLQSPVWNRTLRVSTVIIGYVAIYLGIATLLGRWGQRVSNDVKPGHVRVIVVLMITAGVIFPLILRMAEAIQENRFSVFDVTSPPLTIDYLLSLPPKQTIEWDWSSPQASMSELISKRGYGDIIIVLVLLAAGFFVVLNLWSLGKSVFGLKPLNRPRSNYDEPVSVKAEG